MHRWRTRGEGTTLWAMSLRYAILGLLAARELSGYELTKTFDQSVAYFWHARSQQIYPELARLEEDGLVVSEVVAQVGRPDKRVYRITPDGVSSLQEWVTSPSPLTLVKDEFMVKVWSYGLVDPEQARRALGKHRERHEERLASYRVIADSLGGEDPSTMDGWKFGALLTVRGGVGMEEAFVEWCRETEALLAQRAAMQPSATRGAG